jgi:amino acid adenylation domain-containing protein
MEIETGSGERIAPGKDNQTARPRAGTIHALFAEQAALSPLSVAIEFDDQTLSYGQIDEQASRLARRLRRLGVGPGTLVGLCMVRSPEMIGGMLGILKAGAAYVPLDPDYPDKRLSFMIRDTGTPVIVAHRPTANRLAPSLRHAQVVWIDRDDDALVGYERADDCDLGPEAPDLACVIYSSGPTGFPQGIMIGHGSVLSLIRDTSDGLFGKEAVVLQHAPISSDASIFEIWGALLNGGRLVMMPPRTVGPDGIGAAIRDRGVTTLRLSAGLFHLMIEQRAHDLRPLRHLLVGGDAISPPHVHRALVTMRNGTIVTSYGHTESTSFVCRHRISRAYRTGDTIPIGCPISKATIHVLDDALRPVPVGSPGELWIGGDSLALGYLNHSALTRQRFIHDPFSAEPGARVYRTGDLACYRRDSEIELVGRLDNQVNILEHRIEPGEIEAALRQHPEVRQTVVVAATGPGGVKRLVAYVVTDGPRKVDAPELNDHLARRLPRYMIPSLFVPIDSLPLSPNGKVDRSALAG